MRHRPAGIWHRITPARSSRARKLAAPESLEPRCVLSAASATLSSTGLADHRPGDEIVNVSAPPVTSAAVSAPATAWSYLDDLDRKQPPAGSAGAPPVATADFPRLNMTEAAKKDIELASKYDLVSYTAARLDVAAQLKREYPETVVVRMFLPRSFQSPTNVRGASMPFRDSGPITVDGKVYPGHWLYLAGSTTTKAITSTSTTVTVADPSRFQAGQYVVVYDAPAGSFDHAEHVKVLSVNKSTKTLTLGPRGYKSASVAHPAGSIIAQHDLGSGGDGGAVAAENWAYNQSSDSPKDGRGKQLNVVLAEWLAANLNKNGQGQTIGNFEFDGVLFDGEMGYFNKDSNADTNNDLVPDGGIDKNGVSTHGVGFEKFYSTLRSLLPRDKILIGGNGDVRGFSSLNGAQLEGYPNASTSFVSPAKYTRTDEKLISYAFHAHQHAVGPSYNEVLSKTPTKLYPKLENGGTAPTSNSPFRYSFGFALLDSASYGQRRDGVDAWWDEYAVDVKPGSPTFGQAIPDNPANESRVRANTGWLGKPLGPRVRLYDSALFAPGDTILKGGGFEQSATGWTAAGVTISRDTNAGNADTGSASLGISKLNKYVRLPESAHVDAPRVHLLAGTDYTLAFSAKSSALRQIQVQLGDVDQGALVSTGWRNYVMTFRVPTTGDYRPSFLVGRENSQLWLDEVYLFKGTPNVFRRDFENGIVIVNASPVAQQVSLGGTFQRIKGTQDPINNGGTVSGTITIGAYDAAILVRPEGKLSSLSIQNGQSIPVMSDDPLASGSSFDFDLENDQISRGLSANSPSLSSTTQPTVPSSDQSLPLANTLAASGSPSAAAGKTSISAELLYSSGIAGTAKVVRPHSPLHPLTSDLAVWSACIDALLAQADTQF